MNLKLYIYMHCKLKISLKVILICPRKSLILFFAWSVRLFSEKRNYCDTNLQKQKLIKTKRPLKLNCLIVLTETTFMISGPFVILDRWNEELNADRSPMSSRTSFLLVVPTTNSLLSFGGTFFTSAMRACRTMLLNLPGHIGT